MPHRQTVEFLRRRYAAAILCDDAATAGRVRVQLDGLMNQNHCARRLAEVLQPEAARPLGVPLRPLAAERATGGPGPRLRLVTPVTGLLEWPRGGRHGSG
jgi:hypothetical protein